MPIIQGVRLKNSAAVALVSILLSFASPAFAASADAAKDYPNRPVRLIMGPGAGGPTDSVGRVLASKLTEIWGQTVVIENRPGAGNTIATAAAAKATPDGYTLLLCPISDAVAPALYRKLPYDFQKDIAAISHIGVTPNVFVVPPSLPVKSVKDFIAYAKANPGKLNYGGLGVGQSGHLSMELLKMMTGIDVVYVPYKTSALAVTDLLTGRMDAQITNLPVHVENIRVGKVRALGVTSAKRTPRFPELPAIAETVPGFSVDVWYGICSPAGVPRPIVNKVNAGIVQALKEPDVQKRMENYGVDTSSSTPEQFVAYIKSETVRWAKVVKAAGIPQQ
jgi:tripartite-type tricarboxylate transporter receptor subunit TctC